MSVAAEIRGAAGPLLSRPRVLSLRASRLATPALHGLVLWLYLWFATAGSFDFRDEFEPYYDRLADAFLAGQLHLKISPAPELLALADPYDPEQHRGYQMGDASLYKGRYYLYFGPLPGLLHALWKSLTGLACSERAMGVLFGFGGSFWFWLLARELRDRAFPRVSDGQVRLGYLCYALGAAGPFLQARPSVYHEAILAGSFFTLAGSYFWLRGLAADRSGGWQLALAGLLFGCGFASRWTMLAYALGAGLVMLRRWLGPCEAGRGSATRQVLAFGLPMAGITTLLLLYNYARFDAFTEFGHRYLLTGYSVSILRFDPGFVPHNLAAYLFFVPSFLPYYPFQVSETRHEWLSGADRVWVLEPSFAAALLLAPVMAFAPLALGRVTPTRRPASAVHAFVVAGGLGALSILGALLLLSWASVRYMQDFLPIACLLGLLGLWRLQPRDGARRSGRLAWRGLTLALPATALGMGLSLGLSEMNIRNPTHALRVAYGFDSAVAALLPRVIPSAWPASYFDEAVARRPFGDAIALEPARRPLGIFYPARSTLTLPAPSGVPIDRVEVDSLFPARTRVAVEIDGRMLGEQSLRPGAQAVCVPGGPVAGPTDRVDLRLHFPGEPGGSDGVLRPLRVRSVGSSAHQPRLVQEQWAEGKAMLRVDLCNPAVVWRTRDRTVGQVYLSVNGGPETLFGTAGEASYDAPWVSSGNRYAFRLYAGTERRRLIATSTVAPR